MNLLHPWAIGLGLALASLPVVIHWLTRPRPARLPLSTLRFVREVIEQRRARWRLRDWLVLLLRTAAVCLLALAIARPLNQAVSPASPAPGGVARVLLVDVSQSMAAVDRGIGALERARPAAAHWLGFAPQMRASLILAGARPHPVFEELSPNLPALRESLAKSRPLPQRLAVQPALRMAGDLLAATAKDSRRELVVFSDFQRTNWSTADFSVLPSDTHIELVSASGDTPPPNLAIVRAAITGRASTGDERVLEVEVANFSSADQHLAIEASLGTSIHRLEGTCGRGGRSTLAQPIKLSGTGWHQGLVRLLDVHDALRADDERAITAEVRPSIQYALMTRQPPRQPLSSTYIEYALVSSSVRSGQPSSKVNRISSLDVDREQLGPAALIVLDHPGKLAKETISLLAGLARRGRPLLYVVAEPVDAVNLKLLAAEAGSAWRLPVEFLPEPSARHRRELFLSQWRTSGGPLAVFGESWPGLAAPLRFGGGLPTRPLPGALAEEILATYNDRSACLVQGTCGSGRVAVINAELAASNLAAEPVFVPLVQELVGSLVEDDGSREALSGEPIAVYLPPSVEVAAGLQVLAPDGSASESSSLADEGVQVLWRSPALGPPGTYQVCRGSTPVFCLASTLAAEESDLTPLPAEIFQRRLAGGRQLRFHSSSEASQGHDDAWVGCLIGCLACMLAELVVLRIFLRPGLSWKR